MKSGLRRESTPSEQAHERIFVRVFGLFGLFDWRPGTGRLPLSHQRHRRTPHQYSGPKAAEPCEAPPSATSQHPPKALCVRVDNYKTASAAGEDATDVDASTRERGREAFWGLALPLSQVQRDQQGKALQAHMDCVRQSGCATCCKAWKQGRRALLQEKDTAPYRKASSGPPLHTSSHC